MTLGGYRSNCAEFTRNYWDMVLLAVEQLIYSIQIQVCRNVYGIIRSNSSVAVPTASLFLDREWLSLFYIPIGGMHSWTAELLH